MVLLLFQVGVETRLHELVRIGLSALLVGAMGVALPFAAGLGLAALIGEPIGVAIFLAAALTATSVGITRRVLGDLGVLGTISGRVILGAAVIDDVLAMLILAFASGIAAGTLSAGGIAQLVVLAVAFIGVVLLGGTRLLQRRRPLQTDPQFAQTPFLPGMIVMLGLAALAASIGLAAIIGAFLAGMVSASHPARFCLLWASQSALASCSSLASS